MNPIKTNTGFPKHWSLIYTGVRKVLLVAILGYLGWQIVAGRQVLTTVVIEWRPIELFAGFILAILGYQSLFVAWLVLLKRTQLYEPHRFRLYARAWWISYLYRYVPGKLMLLVERARLGMDAGIPYAAGAALPIVETVFAVAAGCTVSLLAVSYYTDSIAGLLVAIVASLIAIFLLTPFAYRRLMRIAAIRQRLPNVVPIDLRTIDIFVLVAPYIAHYLLLGTSFFLLIRSVHFVPWSAAAGICGVYALSHVIGIVVLLAPGGLGMREGAIAIQLQSYMHASTAGTLAIVSRLWFTSAELVCLLFANLIARHSNAIDGPNEIQRSP